MTVSKGLVSPGDSLHGISHQETRPHSRPLSLMSWQSPSLHLEQLLSILSLADEAPELWDGRASVGASTDK